VQVAGDGSVVVLLHGFPDSLHMWRTVVPHLVAAGHRVVAPDQRGCGDSPAPQGRAHYGIEQKRKGLYTLA
jgi:pimeloyl-ACP methyl ester carboxylesterase